MAILSGKPESAGFSFEVMDLGAKLKGRKPFLMPNTSNTTEFHLFRIHC